MWTKGELYSYPPLYLPANRAPAQRYTDMMKVTVENHTSKAKAVRFRATNTSSYRARKHPWMSTGPMISAQSTSAPVW